MSDYTPGTNTVRLIYIDYALTGAINRSAEFDRWLIAHDAEIRDVALEEASVIARITLAMTWLDPLTTPSRVAAAIVAAKGSAS